MIDFFVGVLTLLCLFFYSVMPIFLLHHAYTYSIMPMEYFAMPMKYFTMPTANSVMPTLTLLCLLGVASLGKDLLCYAYKNCSRERRASSAILHHAYRVHTTSFCFFSFENISHDRITPESLHVSRAIFSLAVKSLSRLLEAECRQRVSTRTG